MQKPITASAPGKIILSGEHSVVYGYPALISAINLRLSIDSKGGILSRIPIGCGMGSSAALAVASSALKVIKGSGLNLEKVNSLAYELEKKQHGNPSGVDNTVSTYGGFLWYRKESESLKLFKSIRPKNRLDNLYVINTGRPLESTAEMVAFVNSGYKKNKAKIESVFKSIEQVARAFLNEALSKNGSSAPDLIKENESLLESLGVVSESTIGLIRRIEKFGGSAKVCGAGGIKGNSGVILVFHKDKEKLFKFAKTSNLEVFAVKFGTKGVYVK